MNLNAGAIPLLAKEGWPRHQKMVPFRKGADGVVKHKVCFGMRFKRVVWLTTLYVSRCRAHAARPSAALRWLRDFLLMPHPPLLGKEGNSAPFEFVRSFDNGL